MIAKLQSPLFAAVLGILLSIGVGVYFSARAIVPALEQAVATAAAAKKAPQEQLKQRGWDFWTIEIDNLSNELKEERARLRKQTEQLDLRAARVAAEEKELAKVRGDIERLRKEIAEKVIEISTDESKNLRTLSQTYTNLTPRAAVAIFKEMDDTTAVKILSLMKADVVGPIFEEMTKAAGTDTALARRAAMLSEKLRLMRANKPASSA
jgi:flagellar motility protein MotE (MotC chaperone)